MCRVGWIPIHRCLYLMPTCICAIKEKEKMTYVCVCVYMCMYVNIEGRKREGSAETKKEQENRK